MTAKKSQTPAGVDHEKMQQIHDELERKTYDFYTLFEISKELNGTLDHSAVIKVMIFTCMAQLGTSEIHFFLLENFLEEKESARFVYAVDKGSENMKKVTLDNRSPLTAILSKHTKLMTRQELAKYYTGFDYELCLPLMGKKDLIGILFIGKKNAANEQYQKHETEFLSLIGSFTSLALENARLYGMAITDGMTHLYTNRYFQIRMNEELKRFRRYKRAFSILLMDIDHFKGINDTYGHQAGDYVLAETAKIIKESLRGTDLAARYGGDELAIILSETENAMSIEVAERIRQSVQAYPYDFEGKRISVAMSIGVATIDESLVEKGRLIEKADNCLYKSKENGRNRVTA